jgi:RNA polymerase sigma factor for flagellar operon FliA
MHRALKTYAASARTDEEQLLLRHLPMLDRNARRLALRTRTPNHFDDYWSAGAAGLVEASRRFDPSAGTSFEAFVEHRVRGAMLDELRRIDHLPRRLRQQSDLVAQARSAVEARTGRECTLEELADESRLDIEEVAELEQLSQPLLPLEVELVDEAAGNDARLDAARLRELLALSVARLNDRLQLLLSLVYVEGLSYSEVAQLLKVSVPRVCQLHKDALEKLRAMLAVREPGLE